MHESLRVFYEQVISCERNCEGIICDRPDQGYLPCGYFTEGEPEDVELAIVGLNPGQPYEDSIELYELTDDGVERFRKYNGLQGDIYQYVRSTLHHIPPTRLEIRTA